MRFGQMEGMKKLALAAAALVCAFTAASAQPAPPPRGGVANIAAPPALTGPARDEALAQANAALNAVTTMQGRFSQIAPDLSVASGTFYLQRPGRLRFEYDPPATLIIISDGRVVSTRDRALRTTERWPLSSTPLRFVLAANIDLGRDARVTRVARDGQALLVTARDRSGVADGEITMRFAGPNRTLQSWEIIDAAGGQTRIVLTNVTQPESLDRRLFRQEDIIERRSGRP